MFTQKEDSIYKKIEIQTDTQTAYVHTYVGEAVVDEETETHIIQKKFDVELGEYVTTKQIEKVITEEVLDKVIIKEYDRETGEYVAKEFLTKVEDNPETEENEEETFWETVKSRLTFWRTK